MTKHTKALRSPIAASVLATATAGLVLAIFAEPAAAQQATTPAQQPTAPAADTAETGKLLSAAEIREMATAAGLQVEDVDLYDRIAEVEGRDSSGREVEWVYDRRNGEVLSREFD